MILRRYGSFYHSVRPNFNPTAITEIGFMRDRVFSIRTADFDSGHKLVETHELVAEANAAVQRHAEKALLANLEDAVQQQLAQLAPGQVVVVLNEREDWPKTRERREAVIVEGENRFHFHWWVDPPLRVAVYSAP